MAFRWVPVWSTPVSTKETLTLVERSASSGIVRLSQHDSRSDRSRVYLVPSEVEGLAAALAPLGVHE